MTCLIPKRSWIGASGSAATIDAQLPLATMPPVQPRFCRCAVEHVEVRRVHLGDDERHVRLHAVVLRVRQHELARARRTPARRRPPPTSRAPRRRCRPRSLRGIARQRPSCRATLRRHRVAADPARRFGVRLARRALRRGDSASSNHGWFGEQPDERLPDRAGGAEHGDAMRVRPAIEDVAHEPQQAADDALVRVRRRRAARRRR